MVWPIPTKKDTCYNCGDRPGMWPWSENTEVPKPTQNNLPESKHCSAKTFGWFPVGEPDILSEINSNSLSKCPDGQVEEVNNRKFLNTITGNNVANTFPKEQEFYNHTGKRLFPYGNNTNQEAQSNSFFRKQCFVRATASVANSQGNRD